MSFSEKHLLQASGLHRNQVTRLITEGYLSHSGRRGPGVLREFTLAEVNFATRIGVFMRGAHIPLFGSAMLAGMCFDDDAVYLVNGLWAYRKPGGSGDPILFAIANEPRSEWRSPRDGEGGPLVIFGKTVFFGSRSPGRINIRTRRIASQSLERAYV